MFRGSMVAIVTPMQQGEVDVARLRALVDYHVEQGTHAIVVAGTTGESGTLTHDEKRLVIQTVIDASNERVPVIAGTGMNATRDCIALTNEAMELGAHAALIMTPAYIRPTQAGLYQHYQAVAQAVAIPIIVYNVPGRTGCDLLPETVGQLARISNIVGIKEAVSESLRLKELREHCGDLMDIYSGDDPTAAEWMLDGAKGVISVTANVAAMLMAKLADAALDGDKTLALRLNDELASLHRLLFEESNPIPAKWALYRMGLIENDIRLPLTELTESNQLALEKVLHTLALIK